MPNLSHREVYMEWHKAAPRTVLGHLRGHCGGLKKPDLKRRFHANRNEPVFDPAPGGYFCIGTNTGM